jgi:hypothetical protein
MLVARTGFHGKIECWLRLSMMSGHLRLNGAATSEAWKKVSIKLLEASIANGSTGRNIIDQTAEACKAWFNLLMKKHRVPPLYFLSGTDYVA